MVSPFMTGNVKNYVKTLDLTRQWNKNKNNPGQVKKSLQEGIKIASLLKPEPQYKLEFVQTRLDTGKKLTPGELEYLRTNHPELYAKALRIAREREEYERELKRCRTKEQVRSLHLGKIAALCGEAKQAAQNGDTAAAKDILMRVNAMSDAHIEYTKTREYASLPNDYRELREQKAKKLGKPLRPAPMEELLYYNIQARKYRLGMLKIQALPDVHAVKQETAVPEQASAAAQETADAETKSGSETQAREADSKRPLAVKKAKR